MYEKGRYQKMFGIAQTHLWSGVTNFSIDLIYIKNVSVSIVTNYAKNKNVLVGANIPPPKGHSGHQHDMIKVTILQ